MPFSTIFLCAVQTTNHHIEMDIQNVLIQVVLGSKPEPTIIDFGEYLIVYLLPRSSKFCLVLKSQRDNQYTCQTIDEKNVIDACNQSLSISSHMRITCNQFRLVFTVAVSTILIYQRHQALSLGLSPECWHLVVRPGTLSADRGAKPGLLGIASV